MGTLNLGGTGDVGRNMFFATLSHVAIPASGLITAPILAQNLGVDGRGELAAATAPLLLFAIVFSMGIPDAATYWIAKNAGNVAAVLKRAALLVMISGASATLVTFILAPWLSAGSAPLAALICAGALATTPTILVAVLRSVAAGLHRWSIVNRERYVTAFVRFAIIVVAALLDLLSLELAIIAIAISPVVGGLPYLRLVAVTRSIREPSRVVRSRSLVGFGGRVWIGSLAGVLLSRVDQILITPLAGTVQLGLYVAAVNVADATLMANNAVREITFSTDAATNDNARTAKMARLSFLVSLCIGLALAISLPLWLPVLFGPDFAGAVPVAWLLIAASVLGVPGSIAGASLAARNNPGLRSSSLVIAVVVNIVLVILLVPSWGAVGAAVATLVGNLVSANLNIMHLYRLHGVAPTTLYLIKVSDLRVLILSSWKILAGRR